MNNGGYYYRKFLVIIDLFKQLLHPSEVAVVGSVHRENVGDMALSHAVLSMLEEQGSWAGMQLLGEGRLGLPRWPLGDGKAIVAGGALGREKRIRPLRDRFREKPDQVALVGISFWSLDDLSQNSLDFLRRVSYISCRNRKDVQSLRNVGIPGARFAHDNAFALPVAPSATNPKQLGVNVVSRHMVRQNGRYCPSDDRPEFGPKYIRCVRRLAQSYLDSGWSVVHVPFTKDDELYANHIFEGIDVEEREYDYDVDHVYECVSQCTRFIATRYHAHIFSLLSQTPLLSFSYASKCTLLKQDLGIPDLVQATRGQIINNGAEVAKRFSNQKGFVLGDEQLREIRHDVRNNIENAYEAVLAS